MYTTVSSLLEVSIKKYSAKADYKMSSFIVHGVFVCL